MRRKPSSQNSGGYNNQQRRPRYQGSGGGEQRPQGAGHHHPGQGGRPRKNYSAMREKYLAQARDMLASGDRVLAENYFQHADHCYRMMVEEGYFNRNQNASVQQPADANDSGNVAQPAPEETVPENTNALPAFITASYDPQQQATPAEQPVQNWEERDA